VANLASGRRPDKWALNSERSCIQRVRSRIKVRLADLEVAAGFEAVDLPFVELLEDKLEKRIGEAFGQLFFYNPE
jgi:hypothetical protein